VLPTLAKNGDDARPRAAADLTGDALSVLRKAIDSRLQAVTSGDVTQAVPAVTSVVTGLVNTVTATLLGGGLPAANLPGLPVSTPSLPATPALRVERPGRRPNSPRPPGRSGTRVGRAAFHTRMRNVFCERGFPAGRGSLGTASEFTLVT
jgi:hypothetical protein